MSVEMVSPFFPAAFLLHFLHSILETKTNIFRHCERKKRKEKKTGKSMQKCPGEKFS